MVWSYNGNDTALDTAGNILAGRIFTVWTAETGGTQLTSTVRNWAGSTVTSGQITSESDGRIRFKETSNSYSVLWLKAPDNAMYPVPALEAVGAGGGVSLSASNTWTGSQTFSGGINVHNDALVIADTAGLQAALDARVNPVYRGAVANEAAMLALSANLGDSAMRSDLGTFWFLWNGSNPATLSNWVEIGGGTVSPDSSGVIVWRYTGGAWPSLPGSKPTGATLVMALGPSYPGTVPSWVGLGATQVPLNYRKVSVA